MIANSNEEGSAWDKLPIEKRLPRTPDAVGVRCAADGCPTAKGITYDKPLCYKHWKEFDALRLFECERCHWFDELVGELTDKDLCFECVDRERRGFDPTPVYAHAPVEPRVRYLYILKLDNGDFYVGQTNDLEMRLQEHREGKTPSTRGKSPHLVWFEKWVGLKEDLDDEESTLTRLAHKNPRAIRRMIADWQREIRLVNLSV